MDFEKFLKKKGYREWNPKTKVSGKITSLSTKSLGEWAWDEVKIILKNAKFPSGWSDDAKNLEGVSDFFIDEFLDNPKLEIAVACLGRGEVKERLKKLEEIQK